MRKWTAQERQRQAELIRRWKPWKTAGVKTPEGKAKSRMNAFKHGAYSAEVKAIRSELALCRKRLNYVKAMMATQWLALQTNPLKNNISDFAKMQKTVKRIIKTQIPSGIPNSWRGPPGMPTADARRANF